jgi:adenine-specific DNA-methyltransferase
MNMDKLKMHSVNKVDENIKKIAELFPNTLTEVIKGYRNDGTPIIEHAIDFDVLRQELSDIIVEGPEERYQFTWPDKKKSILLANAPIAKTLRPCREESVDFDTTENLYIEGDNLDALKLLQETYLGKVKMIYIDPPYNTGNDFVYEDDFAQSADEYLANSGQFDEDGNRLVQNTESNGRFHTDWLNMMYPRLKLAKDLLSDDGVIFISIDDNEVENLKKICNEVFGEKNFLGIVTWNKKRKGSFLSRYIISLTEYVIVYSKKRAENIGLYGGEADASESQPIIKRTNKITELEIPKGV